MGELFEMSGAVSQRLQRIAELLELSPDEALEFVELFLYCKPGVGKERSYSSQK